MHAKCMEVLTRNCSFWHILPCFLMRLHNPWHFSISFFWLNYYFWVRKHNNRPNLRSHRKPQVRLIGLSSCWLGQGRREFYLHTTGFDEEGAQSLTFVHKFLFVYFGVGKHSSRCNLRSLWKPHVKLHWQRDGRSFTCTSLGLNAGPYAVPGSQKALYQRAITPGLFLLKFPTLELRAHYNTHDSAGTFPVFKPLTTFLNSHFSI